jgi:hypothetical protein
MNTNLIEIALGIYKTFGREAAKRALTPPKAWVESACKKTGADINEALEERNEAVEELLEFIESIADKNFVDPD